MSKFSMIDKLVAVKIFSLDHPLLVLNERNALVQLAYFYIDNIPYKNCKCPFFCCKYVVKSRKNKIEQ